MSRHNRRARSLSVDFQELLTADEQLCAHHTRSTEMGMVLGQPRCWRRRDGSYTVRFVWRARKGCVTTSLVYTSHYVPAS